MATSPLLLLPHEIILCIIEQLDRRDILQPSKIFNSKGYSAVNDLFSLRLTHPSLCDILTGYLFRSHRLRYDPYNERICTSDRFVGAVKHLTVEILDKIAVEKHWEGICSAIGGMYNLESIHWSLWVSTFANAEEVGLESYEPFKAIYRAIFEHECRPRLTVKLWPGNPRSNNSDLMFGILRHFHSLKELEIKLHVARDAYEPSAAAIAEFLVRNKEIESLMITVELQNWGDDAHGALLSLDNITKSLDGIAPEEFSLQNLKSLTLMGCDLPSTKRYFERLRTLKASFGQHYYSSALWGDLINDPLHLKDITEGHMRKNFASYLITISDSLTTLRLRKLGSKTSPKDTDFEAYTFWQSVLPNLPNLEILHVHPTYESAWCYQPGHPSSKAIATLQKLKEIVVAPVAYNPEHHRPEGSRVRLYPALDAFVLMPSLERVGFVPAVKRETNFQWMHSNHQQADLRSAVITWGLTRPPRWLVDGIRSGRRKPLIIKMSQGSISDREFWELDIGNNLKNGIAYFEKRMVRSSKVMMNGEDHNPFFI